MAEAQSAEGLRDALLHRLILPRSSTLRTLLAVKAAKRARVEAAIVAIYGAMWYRLLLGEPLDDAFAGQLAALFEP
jgi:hypothetical protein